MHASREEKGTEDEHDNADEKQREPAAYAVKGGSAGSVQTGQKVDQRTHQHLLERVQSAIKSARRPDEDFNRARSRLLEDGMIMYRYDANDGGVHGRRLVLTEDADVFTLRDTEEPKVEEMVQMELAQRVVKSRSQPIETDFEHKNSFAALGDLGKTRKRSHSKKPMNKDDKGGGGTEGGSGV